MKIKGIYTICGGDGSGKTTTAKLLSSFFGVPYVKFPYGSDNDTDVPVYSGMKIRELLNDTENPCDPVAFQALQFVNKLETIPVINDLVRKHGAVIVDRWWLSALIYGTVDGVDGVWSKSLYDMLADKMKPTKMFILCGEPHKTDEDIYGKKQAQVCRLYEDFCEENGDDESIIRIDIDGKSIDTVALEIIRHILDIECEDTKVDNGSKSISSATSRFIAGDRNRSIDIPPAIRLRFRH